MADGSPETEASGATLGEGDEPVPEGVPFLAIDAVDELDLEGKREVGKEAVWSLSGAKSGNGVEQLVDNSFETFWQSDGSQPHLVTLQFHKKTSLLELAIYLDYRLDESYTPRRISIRSGTTSHDLTELARVAVTEPTGWIIVPLGNEGGVGVDRFLRAHILQVAVINMHQNGRDTHVRQIKVFAPKASTTQARGLPEFSSVELSMFSCIR